MAWLKADGWRSNVSPVAIRCIPVGMIRFPEPQFPERQFPELDESGGYSLFTGKRPWRRLFIFFLFLAGWLLTGCAAGVSNQNWPGLATDGQFVYVAYGAAVAAYEPATETERWLYSTENRALHFNAPPSVQDGRIILGDYGAAGGMFSPSIRVSIYGLEEDGNTAPTTSWINDTVAKDMIIAAPLQVGDVTYVGTADNHLLALDANTGAEMWRFDTEGPVWAQPTYHEGILYVTSLDRHAYALDADSGEELWQAELGGAISAQPVVNPEEELVYVGAYDNALHALDINDGSEQWQVAATNWVWSAPALADGRLYFVDSNAQVYAVDAATGDLIWNVAANKMRQVAGASLSTPETVNGAVQASPVIADGRVYIASEGNRDTEEGLLVALDADSGEEVWQRTVRAPLFTTPVIVDDVIVVAMNSEEAVLAAYDLESGDAEWTYLPVLE